MTQHIYPSQYQGRAITILMGWDRLQGFFMVVDTEEESCDEPIYSNLLDPELAACGGLAPDLSHFIRVLKKLGLSVPEHILQEVKLDGMLNRGNALTFWSSRGEELSQQD